MKRLFVALGGLCSRTIRFIFRLIGRVVIVFMAIATLGFIGNIALYAHEPTLVIPVYKAINGYFHDKKVNNIADVQEIFNKIKELLPNAHRDSLQLFINPTLKVNAYMYMDGTVILTEGILKKANYDAGAIAGIIGHEVAHYIIYKTSGPREPGKTAFNELLADNMGLLLGKAAGYNSCNVANLWESMLRDYGERVYVTSHPPSSYRMYNINLLCKRII